MCNFVTLLSIKFVTIKNSKSKIVYNFLQYKIIWYNSSYLCSGDLTMICSAIGFFLLAFYLKIFITNVNIVN